jgi:hypothetical protein
MNLVKRNAKIVALVKARKMPMREIAARYRLSTSSISLIAIRHGVHARAADPKKVRAASKLIQGGMPLRHVAQTVGLNYQRLRQLLEKQGVYKVPAPNRRWSEREVRILRVSVTGRRSHVARCDVSQRSCASRFLHPCRSHYAGGGRRHRAASAGAAKRCALPARDGARLGSA